MLSMKSAWMISHVGYHAHPQQPGRCYTNWVRWFAWYPVIRYGIGSSWKRPWSIRLMWLQWCGWRQTNPEPYYYDYESHYVPWHIAVGMTLLGEEYTCLND